MATATRHPQIQISTHRAVLFISTAQANKNKEKTSGTTGLGENDTGTSDTGSSRGPSLRPAPAKKDPDEAEKNSLEAHKDQVEQPAPQPTDTHLLAMIEGLLSNVGDIFLFFFGCCEEKDPEKTNRHSNKHGAINSPLPGN